MKKLLFGIYAIFFIFQLEAQFCHPVDSLQYAGNRPPGCQLVGPIYQGSTEGFTAEVVTDKMFPCGTVENNQFISFVANGVDFLASAQTSNCLNEGIQLVVFDSKFEPVSNCFASNSATGFNNITTFKLLNPGEIYFMMIDGIGGDICDVSLSVTSGFSNSFGGNNQAQVKLQHDFELYCRNSETCFSFEKMDSATGYQWTIPNTIELLSGGQKTDTFACVKIKDTLFQVIGVVPIFDTIYGAAASFLIEVNERVAEIDTIICPGSQIVSGDSIFSKIGTYQADLYNINATGCDSTIFWTIKMPDISPIEVEYFYDEFLEAITFSWERRPLADSYELTLNGQHLSRQNYVGYLLKGALPGDVLKLEVRPVGVHECEYEAGKLSFIVPDFLNSEGGIAPEIKILPNPSKDIFEIFSEEKVLKTVVFNSAGQKMKEEFSHQDSFGGRKIDISDFETGVYFFKILMEERVVLKKVLKI